MRMWVWILLLLVVAALAWIRLAPSDAARWHQPVTASEDKTFASGAVRVLPHQEGRLDRLHEIALATPRTSVLAGSPAEGRTTYITRSKVMGFPDYTTVERDGDQIRLYARLRFGRSDMGVNRARLDDWVSRLN